MKKIFLVFTLSIMAGLLTVNAQATLGGGLAYGTEVESTGLGIDGEFFINNELSVSPDLIFFFWDDGPFDSRSWWEFNANVNYYFVSNSNVAVYGIGGLNFATVRFESGTFDESQTELGLNLGIGSNFDVNTSFKPFAEFKFVVGDADQAVLFFGLKFNLN